ncbi:hypothetical protein I5M27_08435 [Adhaeribacter sp. BT258]|uniref:DUF4843 domain-containing protein n=1 Tax=Adhaeribacter terrigena TaxID=2793070 RepID=A0ABS1C1G3_9BACT|nr:hypothetical protein [Adhaeribacter terrigena]MBK0403012.1 hypothetical protein [Adhaeribacter terrigena]
MYSKLLKYRVVFLFPALSFMGCELENPVAPVDGCDMFSFSTDSESILADSSSQMAITVHINENVGQPKKVKFGTNFGYLDSTYNFGDTPVKELAINAKNRVVKVILKSETNFTENAFITAFIGNNSCSIKIPVKWAYPEDMILTARKVKFASGTSKDSTIIKVSLFRQSGKVTNSSKVNFSIITTDSSKVQADITPFSLSKNQMANATLRRYSNDTGEFFVKAETQNNIGGTIAKTIKITFE